MNLIARPITSTCYKGHDEDTDTLIAAPLTAGMSATNGVNKPGRRREDDENLVCATLNSGGNSGGFRTEPGEHLITHTLRSEGADAGEDGTGRGTPIVAATLKQRGRGATDEVMDNLQIAQPLRSNRWGGSDSHGDEGNAILNGLGVRRLTPTECERLQGFPDGWTVGHSDSARYRMLGNAVCVPVARWLGERILASLG